MSAWLVQIIPYNNCTSNSQVITQGKSSTIFNCYMHNYFIITLKHMTLPTNHIVIPMTFSPYPSEAFLLILQLLCNNSTFIFMIQWKINIHPFIKAIQCQELLSCNHFSISMFCCHIYPLPCIVINPSVMLFDLLVIMSQLVVLEWPPE